MATMRSPPSAPTATASRERARSVGRSPSSSLGIWVSTRSTKRMPTWLATAATRSFSPTSPEEMSRRGNGTSSASSRASISSSASLERTLRSTRNSPSRREAGFMPGVSASCPTTLSGQSARGLHDDPQDLLDRGHAVAHLDHPGAAQGDHALGDRHLLDVLRVGALHDHAFDVLAHEQHLVDGEAAVVPGASARPAAHRTEQLRRVVLAVPPHRFTVGGARRVVLLAARAELAGQTLDHAALEEAAYEERLAA